MSFVQERDDRLYARYLDAYAEYLGLRGACEEVFSQKIEGQLRDVMDDRRSFGIQKSDHVVVCRLKSVRPPRHHINDDIYVIVEYQERLASGKWSQKTKQLYAKWPNKISGLCHPG